MSAGEEVIPSAKRLMKSLRDLGYDFVTAVADLVDNSVEARASEVHIDIQFDADESWVRIADNGKGMSRQELKEAMRYGSERDYDEDSLGRFGLGLKTASLSQCQYLLVASRNNPDRAYISAYCWDLSHIDKTDKWEIIPIGHHELDSTISAPLEEGTGTVILWKRLDRILGYRHPYGDVARKRILNMCRDLEEHLAMVFHKFLNGEVRRHRLKIFINGNEIQAWDPFARNEKDMIKLPPVSIPLEFENEKNKIIRGEVLVESYILPRQEDFSSTEAWELASGPKKWNQQQGFYIYRAGRLIQSGGWSWIRVIDEHTKLARIAISFSPALDEAFKINVPKMQVQFPAQIREEVKQSTDKVVARARNIYDGHNSSASRRAKPPVQNKADLPAKRQPVTVNPPVPYTPPGNGDKDPGNGHGRLAPAMRSWTLEEIHLKLIEVAEHSERPVIDRVFYRLKLLQNS